MTFQRMQAVLAAANDGPAGGGGPVPHSAGDARDTRVEANDAGNGNGGPGKKPPRRRNWVLRIVLWLVALLFLLLVALVGTVVWVVHTETGTRVAWQAATRILGPKLSGTLDGGAIQTGVRLHDVRWHDGATDIRVDRVAGRWALARAPWRFTVEYLRIGTVDVKTAPAPASPSSGPLTLPTSLVSPLQLDLRDVRIDKVRIQGTGEATEISNIAFHGGSDGRHHQLVLDGVTTPFGSARGKVALDGVKPFATQGDVHFDGALSGESLSASSQISGSLERLVADVTASGMKLEARAHVEATPFDSVPVRLVEISADHFNPQVLSAGAPEADLTIRARLHPASAKEAVDTLVQAAGSSASASAAASGSMPTTTAVQAASVPVPDAASPPLAVEGDVSIVNAIPGALDAHRLPLIDAHAFVRLDAKSQSLESLTVHLVRDAVLTGSGRISQGAGKLALNVRGLDLHALQASLRPTALSGPVILSLNGNTQTVDARLEDTAAAIRLKAAVTATPAQTRFDEVSLQIGKGRLQFTGALQRDEAQHFAFKGDAQDFDPLSLTAPQSAPAPASRSKKTVPAKATNVTNAAKIDARVSGHFDATGLLAPQVQAKVAFALRDSEYDGLPMTGTGTLQIAGNRLLPSHANLSVAGNAVRLDGSFGAARDQLDFDIQAPQLDRLGFGLAGEVIAKGNVTGSIAHPNVSAHYQANGLVFGGTRVGHAEGDAQLHDGANGALNASIDAKDVTAPGLSLRTLTAKVAGTRAKHTIDANAVGSLNGNALDAIISAQGSVIDARAGTGWKGTISQLQNRGVPNLRLAQPVTVSASPGQIDVGATRLTLEGATLDLKGLSYAKGQIRTAGTVAGVDVARLSRLGAEITGKPSTLVTDLVLDGDWDIALGATATGHVEVRRRSGDVQVNGGQGAAGLGLEKLLGRVDFVNGNRAHLTLTTQAARLGTLGVDATATLLPRDGMLSVTDDSALSGKVTGDLPSLRTTGGLLGPTYILDGALALRLNVAGTIGKPQLSGTLAGQKLGATLVDDGIQLNNGVVDVVIDRNVVEFRQVTFHGGKGTLSATGKVQLDADNPNITAKIVADKLELFAAPDRQLSVSGQATVANAGSIGGMAIDGKFVVDRALFDLPKSTPPRLGDDIVIVRSNGQRETPRAKPAVPGMEKPVGPFAPRANIVIDLGTNFHFNGAGATLGLRGALTVHSAPNAPLSAEGNVQVTDGSTYEAFGRKLSIETGYFTFNGPIDNPSINLSAMRRNQEVEAGVRVRGTLRAPDVALVSEPSVPDNEKLSWLLFGHGTDSGTNLGQQSTATAALALLGSAGGKRIAQTVGLDEFTIGTSDSGLTDAQVVSVAKALNEHFVLGYEQGLQTAGYLAKLTWLLSRRWSVIAQAGTFNGLTLQFTNRFD